MASIAAGLALVAGVLFAGAPSASAATTLTLYNGQHEQTTDKLVAGFEKATGIHVQVRNNDEDTFVDQLETEGSRSQADVFYTENSMPLVALEDKGMLAPVEKSTLARTPAKYDSPVGDWVGVSARVSVLVYNPKLIAASALPKTVLALASPKYRGKVAFAPTETDFQPIVTSVVRAYGKARATKWLEGLKANAAGHIYPDNETITDQVNRGSVAMGVINQYYWYRLGSEIGRSNIHSKIAYFAPRDPGYVLDVSGAGILKSSKHKAAAQKFLAYLVSKAGQEILVHSISWEYPIASGVTRSGETPFRQLKPNPITIGQLGNGSTAIDLLQQAGLL